MRILQKYMFQEFFSAFGLAAFVLTFVMILGNLFSLVSFVISKNVSIFIVLKLFLYTLPYSLEFILPIATMAGLLLSLGRLSSDNEIISMRSSGFSTFKLVLPFLVLSLILSLFALILNDRVIPFSHFKRRQIMKEMATQNPTAMLEPGVFINTFDKYIIFVYEIDGNKFRNIRIYEPLGENKPPRIIIAKKGEFINVPDKQILKLKLIDGTSDEINPSEPNSFYKVNFNTYFMNIDFAKDQGKTIIDKKPKDMTLKELWTKIKKLRKLHINDDPLSAEFHKKISMSFSTIVFFLIGIPLGIITRRKEKTANIALAFFIVGIYFILSLCVEPLSKEGSLAPSSGMWIPNIIFGIIGLFLFIKLCES